MIYIGLSCFQVCDEFSRSPKLFSVTYSKVKQLGKLSAAVSKIIADSFENMGIPYPITVNMKPLLGFVYGHTVQVFILCACSKSWSAYCH